MEGARRKLEPGKMRKRTATASSKRAKSSQAKTTKSTRPIDDTETHSTNVITKDPSMSTDPFISKIYARPIDEKYIPLRQLGRGGHGTVFLGRDITTGLELALKFEHHSILGSLLETEAEICMRLNDTVGFTRMFWFGDHDHFKIMAFELLGPSLEDLFTFCEYRFTPKTVFMLMDQILLRLEGLHSHGYLHRDLKPDNFLMGTGKNGNVVYMTDFGIAEVARPEWKGPEKSSTELRLLGTSRYASIRGHEGKTQSFRDDLESLGYSMIYWLTGSLPWQGMSGDPKEKEERVHQMKKGIKIEKLCAGLGEEVAAYMWYVRQLQHGEMPNYDWLRGVLHQRASREGWQDDDVYDWTIRLFLAQ